MSFNHYTPIRLPKKSLQLSHLITNHFEPILLSLLILTGIIGSVYIFGQQLGIVQSFSNHSNFNEPSSASLAAISIDDEPRVANAFDEHIEMDGPYISGEKFFFTFLKDEKASRYVMEMGDGVRLIVTQKNLLYEYDKPGKYTIELKELKGGLMQIIGTKKIKVKG